MKLIQLFVICGTFCCILGENVTKENDFKVQLITESIINPSKQLQLDSFLLWIQSWFGGANTTDLTPAQDCPLCVCGKTNLNRLLNGNETGVNQYPWMAILLYNNEFFCGGSLINDRFVLTAAHCFEFIEQNSIKNITVRLLEHDRSTDTETKLIDRNVQSVLIHPKFTDDTYNNDIVLVKFTKPVKFDEVLKPVCLPTPLLDYDGYNGVVTGWGATQRGHELSNVLKQIEVVINKQVDNNSICNVFQESIICASSKDEEKYTCVGDDGGPLHVVDTKTMVHQIVGIVSWPIRCFPSNISDPNVYTRVNHYGIWINENTIDACKCSQ